MRTKYFNPNIALGRWIRRAMPDFFVLKKFDRSQRYALTFFVEKASTSLVSSDTPNAKFGFNLFLSFALAALLSGCGIPKIKGTLLSSKAGAQVPDLIAILPPDNHSNDLTAVEVIQRSGGVAMTTRGYYSISNKAQDAALQKMGITDGGQLKAYKAENICKTLGVQGLLYSVVEDFNEINIGFWISKKVEVKMNLTDSHGESLWEAEGLYRIRALQLDPQAAAQAFIERKAGELLEKALRVHLVPETNQAMVAMAQKVSPWPNQQGAQRK